MRTIGIKLADGSFYPVMEEGSSQKKTLELTTAHNNQTCVMVDLYRSKTCSMEDAEYIDTLKIENLNEHPNGEPSISFDVDLDENGELSYSIADPETGTSSNSEITLVSRTVEERLQADDYSIEDADKTEEPASEENGGNGAAIAAGAAVAGAGLLAAAAIASNNKDDESDEVVADEGLASFDPDAPAEEVSDDVTIVDDELPDFESTTLEDSSGFMADDAAADDTTFADDALPDFEESVADDATVADDSLPDFDEPATDDDATIADDSTISDDATIEEDTLPDFDEPAADDTIADDATIADDTPFAQDDLPDFDEPVSENNGFVDDDATISDDTLPDFDEPAAQNDDMDFDDPAPVGAGGMDFSGLYDKETEMGNASENQDDDFKKKTRTPVLICIICAIICLIATALVLLVLPTKFNLRMRRAQKKQETAIEKPVEKKAPAEEKKPDPVPQAKEDEVVVIEKAEEVKPLPPPAAETKPAGVTYKIKWGDTLWDIADTYYKNPWRYKKIAKYNNIKNPDHIISGTVITIPAE
ncbi:MAG: LysM peptidoglycan-binding domain-containing protein [Treponema sp.]|nr:LysM peptidoglycan-binding domain-containing protein [Treponema sp.]